MINPDAPTTEVLPGFIRSDLQYLAECLEGRHGEGRRAEAAPGAARFIRAALAVRVRVLQDHHGEAFVTPRARLLSELPTHERYIPPAEVDVASNAFQLTESERRMIEKQRAHAERNRGDDNGDEGLPS